MVTVFTDTQNLTCSFLKTLHIVELLLSASPFKKGKKEKFNFMRSISVH
jgi:hypothetical protein